MTAQALSWQGVCEGSRREGWLTLFRRVRVAGDTAANARAQQAAVAEAAPRKKRERKAFTIDFVDGDAVSSRKLFGVKGTAATIQLSDSDLSAPTLLPDDLRITPADLTRLFLKPLWQSRMQQRAPGADGEP